MAAVSGFAGMEPVLEAISLGKDVALANKETLVAGGNIVMKAVREKGVRLIPVDSEHSAIFQCLNFDLNAKFKKLILTASGGAFRNYTKQEVASLKAQEALKHPNWLMGKKITIDCATLLNKGLEVIEACHLYNAPLSKVEAIVHPESIIHSMVEFDDGAVMAQLGFPSMEIPIQLALTYPERLRTDVPLLELAGKSLTFKKIDEDKYPCFSLALKSFEMGDNYACAMNAANEAAVGLYLQDKIGFYDISDLIEHVLGKIERLEVTKDSLLYTDRVARELVYQKVGVKN
jgi:1-deoxy-D-xylulose-5-phosphate reductoisomerase